MDVFQMTAYTLEGGQVMAGKLLVPGVFRANDSSACRRFLEYLDETGYINDAKYGEHTVKVEWMPSAFFVYDNTEIILEGQAVSYF